MSSVTRKPSPSTLARVTRSIARSTTSVARPLAGRRFFPLWAVLHHRGRRSGRTYAVPVAVQASPDAFTVPLPWGEETQWLRNVLAANGCTLRWRGAEHDASAPRVMDMADASDAFNPVLRGILRTAGVRSVVRLQRDVRTA